MKRKKTIWIREYRRLEPWENYIHIDYNIYHRNLKGEFAIKKYVHYFGHNQSHIYYAVSKSPKRTSWYKDFFDFNSAVKFARNLIKREENNE